jgi:Flp pilus assembly protein TadB
VWKSANPGQEKHDGGYVIDNNVLFGAGPQTIWVKSYKNWGVESKQPDTPGIKAYPSVQLSYPDEPTYSLLRLLRSSFTETMPTAAPNLDAVAAYEVWLDNSTVEVTMWVDNHHLVPAGKLIGKSFIYGQTFAVWRTSPQVYSFVLSSVPDNSGTVHLLSALRWLVNHRRLNTSDTLSQVDFGWQIASTGGVAADLSVTKFAVTRRMKPQPKVQPTVSAPSGLPLSLIIGIAAVFAALFLAALLMFGRLVRVGEDRAFVGMFEKYGPRKQQVAVKNDAENQRAVATAAVGAVTRVMSSGAQDRLSKRLDLAGVKHKPAEWATLGVCLAVGIAATLSIVTSYVFVGVLGGVVIGWLTMRMALSVRILRRRATFSDQLPDLLQLIASTLQAGFSLPQALDAVVREENQPAAGEFSRALAEARIGADLDTALEAIANRMDSDDLRWTVMAIRIQQGVGGNLAEVLLTIAETIRERAYLRRQVGALSAEGRLSAYILIALPLVVATWLFISSATYMRPLYTTTMGELMLALAVILLLVGTFWMRRVIKVEI